METVREAIREFFEEYMEENPHLKRLRDDFTYKMVVLDTQNEKTMNYNNNLAELY